MSGLNQLANRMNRTWESVSSGWNHLIQRAGNALTRFRKPENVEYFPDNVSHWGLMNADVFDNDKSIIVRLEAPGMSADDFDITVQEDMISIKGEKLFEQSEQEGRYQIFECAYGSFERILPLGSEVESENARASYKNGVLKIEINKRGTSKRRRITIN